MEFTLSVEGLYYYNFKRSIERRKAQEQQQIQKVMIVETVDYIKRCYTKREIEQADMARRLYVIMGRPSRESFELMVKGGKLLNSPVTVTDFRNAEKIYGKDLGVIKGKTIRQKPKHVQIESSDSSVEKQVILSVNLLNFLGVIFLTTVSRDFRFITATALGDRKKKTIWEALKQVMNLYRSKGHTIKEIEISERENEHTILVNEFETLREDIEGEGTRVNITAKEEHVPEIERQNHVIKERARSIVQMLPYDTMPRMMKIAFIQYVIYWLNLIPKNGQIYSPRELICGEQKLEFKIICRLPFGAYAQVHKDMGLPTACYLEQLEH